MTEKSYLWTTGGAGDGAVTYTRADWSNITKAFAGCHDEEGVAPNVLNACAGTVTGANAVAINTGFALVDGKPYYNDASKAVTIPSAVGGGNTRIDRIVLRADWTAQTVRITVISGTDAAVPTAPAITQTPGTTYDIMLYQALVDTSGAVTLTDERVMGTIQTAGIADLAVSTAKLAANSVDDTKAGNRVPMLTNRQGGHADNWYLEGTDNYVPTAVKMQAGAVTGAIAGTTVTFPVAFSTIPMVIATIRSATVYKISVGSISTTQFVAYTEQDGVGVQWLAIGTE